MPVTAKLSQAFYDRLGHQVADEMVDWFNQVDAAYRSDLRDLNELNFARFDAKLEQRLAELEAKLTLRIDGGLAALETRIERQIGELSAKIDRRIGEVSTQFADQHVVQLRWMIGMWVAVLATVIGLSFRR